ncbi:SufB/SufD family protein [Companilactobacillus sp. HBUAS59544]|uniref:SufB/SufD family protein n=1 Tax=Companilactobacillus sp. HBUAS59544 TaxID=3109363 RepID=UPI002FF3D61C
MLKYQTFQTLQNDILTNIDDYSMPVFNDFNYSQWPLEYDSESKKNTQKMNFNNNDQTVISFGTDNSQIRLNDEMKSSGIVIEDMKEAISTHWNLLEKYFFNSRFRIQDKLMALNFIKQNYGLFIYLPKNVQLKSVIKILNIQNDLEKLSFWGQILIIGDENSKIKIIQRIKSEGQIANNFNLMVNVVGLNNSSIGFNACDTLGTKTTSFIRRQAFLFDSAELNWSIGCLNNGNSINDFSSYLLGIKSQSDMKILSVSGNEQRQCVNSRIINVAPKTTGNIFQRGAVLDTSELIFNGIGKIQKGAHGSEAEQKNRVLMLSNRSHGDANPILLIDENDVLAGHAASIGRVNDHEMYYLMSRGLTKNSAQNLIVKGFVNEFIHNLSSDDLSNLIEKEIEKKLNYGMAS